MIHQLNMQGKDKVQVAIDRLKMFEPPEGYYLAFSGGKDSVVIKALADMAGVKYDAHYRVTSVDPPELVQFIKKVHPDVSRDRPLDKNGNQITMWNLIPKKRMPPTQVMRYCCKDLKEDGGNGRMTITGVRWAESSNRRANQGHVTVYKENKDVKERLTESGNFIATPRGGAYSQMTTKKAERWLNNATNYQRRLLIQSLIGRMKMFGNSYMNTTFRTANCTMKDSKGLVA